MSEPALRSTATFTSNDMRPIAVVHRRALAETLIRGLAAGTPVRGALAGMLILFTAAGAPAQQVPAPLRTPAQQIPALFLTPPPSPALAAAPLAESAAAPDGGAAVMLQQRQTRRGARYGAIAGGIVGLGMGGFMGLYCAGTQSPNDHCWRPVPLIIGLGIVSGAAAGAILGAAVPGPDAAARPGAADTTGAPAARPRSIGSAGLAAGVAHASIEDGTGEVARGGGTTARLNLYGELRPWLALGPELGIASFGSAGDIRHIAVATRIGLGGGLGGRDGRFGNSRIIPFVTVNAGAYDTTGPSLEFFGGGAGLGVRYHAGRDGRFFADVEGRYSRNLQNIEPMRMRSLSISGGLYW
jgi:hypothetical protein